MDIREIYKKYADIDIGNLSSNEKNIMYHALNSAQPSDLNGIEEHKMYLEILQKMRLANINDMKYMGANFLNTIRSLLTIGEDGVYSNSQRFIYELIQNVDDCEYDNPKDCNLEIQFKFQSEPGNIIFKYNEIGFTPQNVFAITGIAEKSKNIIAGKIEIGEKGIGFKSVFGIAEKVHIESGSFSFELNRDNFTVPVPKYCKEFKPINGTILTLVMSADSVEKIYNNIMKQYINQNVILNQNPILFLNKLTHLKMYFDSYRFIELNVERKNPIKFGDIEFENDINISVDMKYHDNGMDKENINSIKCKRYTKSIIYGENECKSRYGDNDTFSHRCHNLIALFPTSLKNLKNYKGLMYSFLPTQIHTTVPIVLHVPFKLDGSREFVDSQSENQWFNFTIQELEKFLKNIYIHLSTILKQDIINYIPNWNNYIFSNSNETNEKMQCLMKNGLKGETICQEKIFYTIDGTYESSDNIISFSNERTIENPQKLYTLLDLQKKLFIPNNTINMKQYNVEVISKVPELLLRKGLKNDTNFKEIAEILNKIGENLDYEEIIENCCPLQLTNKQLLIINENIAIYDAINKYGWKHLKGNLLPRIKFASDISMIRSTLSQEIKELCLSANIDRIFIKYLEAIDYRFYALKGIKQEFAVFGENGIIVSESCPIGSFASLVKNYTSNNIFYANLQIRQASDKLNETNETMNNEEYLELLRNVRSSIKNAFGNRVYNNYLQILNQSGSRKDRFLNELLQNADDCMYSDNETPTFDLQLKANTIIIYNNEIGFTKQNVRAITAIGESTKKALLEGKKQYIGEKGVGFKSVFGVAESVEIHSNGFDFMLTDKMPTIPEKCEALKEKRKKGTTFIFKMKSDINTIDEENNEEKILRLCLCLRKLKNININNIKIEIDDIGNERIITINKNKYKFEKFIYNFEVNDTKAIEERSSNNRNISKEQYICCYIPQNNKAENYNLYVGLPTTINCLVPLIIDAPFELTTSREDVIECRWNNIIKEKLYDAILMLMEKYKFSLRIDVFKFVKFTSRNGYFFIDNFSSHYLNEVDWLSKLKKSKILPVLNEEKFVSLIDENCFIVPEIIAYILKSNGISENQNGVIIDTYKKSQYNPFLKVFGCKEFDIKTYLNCIKIVANKMMDDEDFREILYNYLKLPSTQQKISEEKLYSDVKALPIFPIRTNQSVKYIAYGENLYTHENKISDNDFSILETNILKYEDAQKIIGYSGRINELSQEVYEARYQNNLIAYIQSDKSKKEKAIYVLNEYNNNFAEFKKCQIALKGMISDIPMEFVCGEFFGGNKFINKNGLIFSGDTIDYFIVSNEYAKLADFLGCKDITSIHYEDMDLPLESISDEDIEDFQNELIYGMEILEHLINENIITNEQIEKYHLQYLMNSSSDEIGYEAFPGKAVNDINRLRKHVKIQFENDPNPYVEKKYTKYEPKDKVDKEAYTTIMYASINNAQKCFCQMCKKITSKKYIERNNIQKSPKYGWKQMYLSLCLNCSKDYEDLRNNDLVWERFIESIKEADVENGENLEIQIGNKTLTFTATHLAEIQTILDLEEKFNEENKTLK